MFKLFYHAIVSKSDRKGLDFFLKSQTTPFAVDPAIDFETTRIKTVADACLKLPCIIALFQNFKNLPKLCATVKPSTSRNAYILYKSPT